VSLLETGMYFMVIWHLILSNIPFSFFNILVLRNVSSFIIMATVQTRGFPLSGMQPA